MLNRTEEIASACRMGIPFLASFSLFAWGGRILLYSVGEPPLSGSLGWIAVAATAIVVVMVLLVSLMGARPVRSDQSVNEETETS